MVSVSARHFSFFFRIFLSGFRAVAFIIVKTGPSGGTPPLHDEDGLISLLIARYYPGHCIDDGALVIFPQLTLPLIPLR